MYLNRVKSIISILLHVLEPYTGTISIEEKYTREITMERHVKENYERELPSYWILCRLEYSDFCSRFPQLFIDSVSWRQRVKNWLLLRTLEMTVLFGIGHFITSPGKIALSIVVRRYACFFLASLGIWTKTSANAFNLSDVYKYLVYFPALSSFRFDPDIRDRQVNTSANFKGENDKYMVSMIKARMGIRTTIFQIFPGGGILTIFCHFTNGFPLYHDCDTNTDNSDGVFKSYFPEFSFKTWGMLSWEQSKALAHKLELAKFGVKRVTDLEISWVIWLRAAHFYVVQSRLPHIIIALFLFVMSISLLFIGENKYHWVIIFSVILCPYSFIAAIPNLILVASIMHLRDDTVGFFFFDDFTYYFFRPTTDSAETESIEQDSDPYKPKKVFFFDKTVQKEQINSDLAHISNIEKTISVNIARKFELRQLSSKQSSSVDEESIIPNKVSEIPQTLSKASNDDESDISRKIAFKPSNSVEDGSILLSKLSKTPQHINKVSEDDRFDVNKVKSQTSIENSQRVCKVEVSEMKTEALAIPSTSETSDIPAHATTVPNLQGGNAVHKVSEEGCNDASHQKSDWKSVIDKISGEIYWWNTKTGETTEVGAPRPIFNIGTIKTKPIYQNDNSVIREETSDWKSIIDKSSGEIYWWNVKTGETTEVGSPRPQSS